MTLHSTLPWELMSLKWEFYLAFSRFMPFINGAVTKASSDTVYFTSDLLKGAVHQTENVHNVCLFLISTLPQVAPRQMKL